MENFTDFVELVFHDQKNEKMRKIYEKNIIYHKNNLKTMSERLIKLLETDTDKFIDAFYETDVNNLSEQDVKNLMDYIIFQYPVNNKRGGIRDTSLNANIKFIYNLIHDACDVDIISDKYKLNILNKISKNMIESLKNIKLVVFIVKIIGPMEVSANYLKKLILGIIESKHRIDDENLEFKYFYELRQLFNMAVDKIGYTYKELDELLYTHIEPLVFLIPRNYYILYDTTGKYHPVGWNYVKDKFLNVDNIVLKDAIINIILDDSNIKISDQDLLDFFNDEFTIQTRIKIINIRVKQEIIDYINSGNRLVYRYILTELVRNKDLFKDDVYKEILVPDTSGKINSLLIYILDNVNEYIIKRLLYLSTDTNVDIKLIDSLICKSHSLNNDLKNIQRNYYILVEYIEDDLTSSDLDVEKIINHIFSIFFGNYLHYEHIYKKYVINLIDNYGKYIKINSYIESYDADIMKKILEKLLNNNPQLVIDILDVEPVYSPILAEITMIDPEYHPLIEKYLNILKGKITEYENELNKEILNDDVILNKYNFYDDEDQDKIISISNAHKYIMKNKIKEQTYYYLARLLLNEPLTDYSMSLVIKYLLMANDYLDSKMYRTRLIQEHYLKEPLSTSSIVINNDPDTIIKLLEYIKMIK